MIRIGLLVNKEQLDTNMEVIRNGLREKVDIINQLLVDFSVYGKQESTSQALEVLKGYANNEIPDMLNRLRDVFNTIIDKTYKIQDRYEQLCGNCSLNEVDLENNIEILDKILKRTEETKYQLLKVEVISTEQINQQIEDIKELKMLYQDKLDGLLEFDRFSTDIFYDESQEIVSITEDLRSLSSSLESPFISTGLFFDRTNIVLDKLLNENQENEFNISTPEQEQILGITYNEFAKTHLEVYGFSNDDILILWEIREQMYRLYDSPKEAEQKYCELIGMMVYHEGLSGLGWENVLGGEFGTKESIISFISKKLKLGDEKANKIFDSVINQHDQVDKIDFAHNKITMATILEDSENGLFLEKYGDGFDDESGWYGDVFGLSGLYNKFEPISINNSDYQADLDSVNILKLKEDMEEKGMCYSYDQITNIYYEMVSSGELNRAEYFKQNRPDVYNHVMSSGESKYISNRIKNDNNPPIPFSSPDANRNYNKEIEEKYRKEYESLSDREKIEWMDNPVKSFAWSLYTNSNEYIECK